MRKFIFTFFFFIVSVTIFAQTGNQVEMADTLRSNGKIYTVVAVILTILIGLFFYLLLLDRKITKLEKQQEASNPTLK